nr:immunoglobulin light chain junction region [Macaca mulatta]MOX77923.1 immunoglobulin light chain junction region [Macaca mulatta]MOX78583.1 immunoglobulin light chain junction region [Macaca mulatta]MOX78810.1 immunoglobulin light chain junction region [Macaca mulatta]MOX80177.1 immunoglobulin light chain junction region [Macaca mulatta]
DYYCAMWHSSATAFF